MNYTIFLLHFISGYITIENVRTNIDNINHVMARILFSINYLVYILEYDVIYIYLGYEGKYQTVWNNSTEKTLMSKICFNL